MAFLYERSLGCVMIIPSVFALPTLRPQNCQRQVEWTGSARGFAARTNDPFRVTVIHSQARGLTAGMHASELLTIARGSFQFFGRIQRHDAIIYRRPGS